jgi:tRNA threonylcarbamoyladenosine biosynthesis protein TsaE
MPADPPPSGTAADPGVLAEIGVPTAARMRELGRRLATLLRPGDLVVLAGQLGAGKTTLVQGVGQGLDVRGPVTSPTFVIAREHPAARTGPGLVHVDAYRLGSRAEVDDLDLDTDVASSVTVVEWGEGLVEELAPAHLRIEITVTDPGPGSAAPGSAAPGSAAPGSAAPGSAAHGGGAPASAPPGGPAPGGEPRTVRLLGRGERWAAAAGEVSRALRSWPAAD